ncbi:MAG: hypothetical protein CMA63_05615 [Euryarchaeota archaeon]|nr:hypothetical protein [Euryarchaeota archaeon]
MGYCISCGQQHQQGIRFCRFCGNQQPGEQLLARLLQEAAQIHALRLQAQAQAQALAQQQQQYAQNQYNQQPRW